MKKNEYELILCLNILIADHDIRLEDVVVDVAAVPANAVVLCDRKLYIPLFFCFLVLFLYFILI